MSDELTTKLAEALRRAFALGQTYWQQADSESFTQNAKSEVTHQKFRDLMAETLAAYEQALAATPAPEAATPAQAHPDDLAVDAFAAAMKDKLAKAREKGRGGWQTCPPEELSRMLREHVEKGDPRDVANFAMFLWSLGQGIAPAQAQQAEAKPLTDEKICEVILENAGYGRDNFLAVARAIERAHGIGASTKESNQ